jgi:hypothetical protein
MDVHIVLWRSLAPSPRKRPYLCWGVATYSRSSAVVVGIVCQAWLEMDLVLLAAREYAGLLGTKRSMQVQPHHT